MTPALINTATYTPPPPPVYAGAMTQNASVVRASIVSVAPSVANVQVGNDAHGGGMIPSAPAAPLPSVAFSTPSVTDSIIGYFNGGVGSQTSFFTQLIAQDASPQAHGILVEYEKMVAMGQVKYLPSNAGIPTPQPENVFAEVLKQEKAASTLVQQQVQIQTHVQQAVVAESAPAAMAQQPVQQTKPSLRAEAKAAPGDVRSPSAHAAAAYVTSARRNDAHLNDFKVKEVEQA